MTGRIVQYSTVYQSIVVWRVRIVHYRSVASTSVRGDKTVSKWHTHWLISTLLLCALYTVHCTLYNVHCPEVRSLHPRPRASAEQSAPIDMMANGRDRHRRRLTTLYLYCIALYCTVLHCTSLYRTVLHCTALYCTVLHFTVLLSTVKNCTALHKLHCTILHYSAVAWPLPITEVVKLRRVIACSPEAGQPGVRQLGQGGEGHLQGRLGLTLDKFMWGFASIPINLSLTALNSMVWKFIWINFGTHPKLRHTAFRISKKK